MLNWICKTFALPTTAACAAAALTTTAMAAAEIRYISTTGSNANPCTRAQPCRTVQRGIQRTPARGELHILDSGFYGNNANVTKSMTISGNGHTVTLGAPITVDRAGATVTMRGLVLNGGDSTVDGIVIVAAGAVDIEHCVIHGFTNDGIRLDDATSNLFVGHSVSRDNGNDGLFTKGNTTISHSLFERNGRAGVNVNLGGKATATSITSASNQWGFVAANGAHLAIESSVVRNGQIGLLVSGGTAVISNSVVTHNDTGIDNIGSVLTRQNNVVTGNTTDLNGSVLTALGGT